MYNICTTIEQSKKLIELGINRTTADMYYSFDYNIEEYEEDAQIIHKSELGQHFSLFPEDIPAWSLTALLDLLPSSLPLYPEATEEEVKEGKYRSSDLIASKEGYLRKRYDGDYQYRYDGIKVVGDFQSPLDAAFEMVCWLLENKKL